MPRCCWHSITPPSTLGIAGGAAVGGLALRWLSTAQLVSVGVIGAHCLAHRRQHCSSETKNRRGVGKPGYLHRLGVDQLLLAERLVVALSSSLAARFSARNCSTLTLVSVRSMLRA